jgi:hypothetical protein
MTDVDDFPAEIHPRLVAELQALHNGDPQPRLAMWSTKDPVTLFGAEPEPSRRSIDGVSVTGDNRSGNTWSSTSWKRHQAPQRSGRERSPVLTRSAGAVDVGVCADASRWDRRGR